METTESVSVLSTNRIFCIVLYRITTNKQTKSQHRLCSLTQTSFSLEYSRTPFFLDDSVEQVDLREGKAVGERFIYHENMKKNVSEKKKVIKKGGLSSGQSFDHQSSFSSGCLLTRVVFYQECFSPG